MSPPACSIIVSSQRNMRKPLELTLLLTLIVAAALTAHSQSNVHSLRVIGTIWELPPEQRAPFIADHSFSVGDYNVMHTKAFGWTLSGPGAYRQLSAGEAKLFSDASASGSSFKKWPTVITGTGDTTNKTISFATVQADTIQPDRPPVLSTNRVMEIAWGVARTERFNTNDYRCDFFGFAGSTTSMQTSNKWILHFVRKESGAPDTDFFVALEDGSGNPAVCHY